MDEQLNAQMKWLREEKEIERSINNNLKEMKAYGDEAALAISNHRLEMLEGLQQTVYAAKLFSYEIPERPVIKKSFKDYAWLILAALFISVVFAYMLIYIFGTIKCPCQ